jgi:hypothetical protein
MPVNTSCRCSCQFVHSTREVSIEVVLLTDVGVLLAETISGALLHLLLPLQVRLSFIIRMQQKVSGKEGGCSGAKREYLPMLTFSNYRIRLQGSILALQTLKQAIIHSDLR